MDNICDDVNVLNIMRVVNNVIGILKIAIPLILIIIIMISFVKAFIKGDEGALNAAITSSIKKFIAAVLIFLVPTIVYAVFNTIDMDVSFINCFKNATNENISSLYIKKARELIDKLYIELNEDDYNLALKYVNRIKDDDIRNEYLQELEQFKDNIDYIKVLDILEKVRKTLYIYDVDENFVTNYLSKHNNPELQSKFTTLKGYCAINLEIDALSRKFDQDKYNELETKINKITDTEIKERLLKKLENLLDSDYDNGQPADYHGVDTPAGGHKVKSCTNPTFANFDISGLSCSICYGSQKIKRNYLYVHSEIGSELVEIFKEVCNYVNSSPYMTYIEDEGFYAGKGKSYHSLGLAFDINVLWSYNGHHPYSGQGPSTWERYQDFVCKECNGNENCDKNVNYQIFHRYFEGKGWCWGGNWGSTSFDPMHFEYRGGCEDNCLTKKRTQVEC